MKEKPVVGIATDGAHSAKERLTRFRAVDLSSGKELFSKAIGNWTNNIGEFLGIVEAVRYVMEHPESPRTIYSDSITAITWYRNKQDSLFTQMPGIAESGDIPQSDGGKNQGHRSAALGQPPVG